MQLYLGDRISLQIPYLLAMIRLAAGLAVLTLFTGALNRLIMPPFDPFSEFADLFPGMSERVLEQRGFLCVAGPNNMYRDPAQKSCQMTPVNSAFSSIEIVTKGETISQTTFVMRQPILLGDLAVFLGSRDFRMTLNSAFFLWKGTLGVASTVDGTRRLFSPIGQVTFTQAAS